jgi:hypothetical protein
MTIMQWLVGAGLVIAGSFTLTLGIIHFFFPLLLDFKTAIPHEGTPLKPLRLGFFHYATQRRDIYGIAYVMNNATSYVLVTIGLLEILWSYWLKTPAGQLLSLWLAGWWFIRAGSQPYLGKRRGDWLVMTGFASFGLLNVVAVLVF